MAAHARIGKTVVHCKRCGRHVDQCGALSWVGQCITCAEQRLTDNLTQLRDKRGESFERWRTGIIRGVSRL